MCDVTHWGAIQHPFCVPHLSYLNFRIDVPAYLDGSISGLAHRVYERNSWQHLDAVQIRRPMASRAAAVWTALFRLRTIIIEGATRINAVRCQNVKHCVILGRLPRRSWAATELLRALQFAKAFFVVTKVRL